ncbi:MAG TPA: hypothetical protein VF744_17785 [Beijerinckiaceae bacterium]
MLDFLFWPSALALAGGPTLERSLAEAAALKARAVAAAGESAAPAPAYRAAERAVSNWRLEAVQDLQPAPVSALAVLLGVERPVVTRCVKLNNYWCIKRARWNGEIGHDDEGHVGFSSADKGADAAVTLLRRYYLDFGRKSALDIVRRWAPAECRGGSGSISIASLAVHGIGQTLRARWLAAQRAKVSARPAPSAAAVASSSASPARPTAGAATAGRKAKIASPRPAAPQVSRVPLRPLPTFRVPDIAVGLGERKVATISASLAPAPRRRQPTPASVAAAGRAKDSRIVQATRPKPVAATPVRVAAATATAATASIPRPAACTVDEGRIRNYAARMVQGLDLGPADDLKLFAPDGTALPNLSRVMLAMSAVELGVLRASMELIEAAIGRATPRPQASAAAPAPPSPSAP